MKKILLMVFAFFVLAFSVSAWHCADSEQNMPAWNNSINGYGPWGDNGLLGGTTWGWLNTNNMPAGCTGQWDGGTTCNDFCDGTTLREFYCTDRPDHQWETIITFHDYENSTQCNEVPEFGPVAIIVAITGAIAGFAVMRKR